jgi:hypothetical protein
MQDFYYEETAFGQSWRPGLPRLVRLFRPVPKSRPNGALVELAVAPPDNRSVFYYCFCCIVICESNP